MKILRRPVFLPFAAFVALASGLSPLSIVLGQGSLTPPAAPGPMMKSLDQIEPRIDLFNAPASAVDTSQSDYHFHIVRSGAYYFSQNLSATKANGILVDAENVTIDFRGFLMQGSGGGDGIHNEQYAGLVVMNGAISGFANGISCPNNFAWTGQVRNMTINSCTTNGMLLGDDWMVKDATVYNCVGDAAIAGGKNCVFENSNVSKNTTTYGISGGTGCRFVNCTADNVTGSAASSSGINAGLGASVIHCTASSNGSGSTGAGITVGDGSNVSECVIDSNHGKGIVGGSRCVFSGDSCRSNGGNGFTASGLAVITNCAAASNTGGAGYSVGAGSVLTHCAADSNHDSGISADTSTIVECTVTGNGADGAAGVTLTGSTGGVIDRCVVSSNISGGIYVYPSGVQVTGNSIHSNGIDNGIDVKGNDCRVVENIVCNNGFGIIVEGTDSLVEANTVMSNGALGISAFLMSAKNNVIVRNTASGNGAHNYSLGSGNRVGPIITPPSSPATDGTTAGPGMGTTDPWANFSY